MALAEVVFDSRWTHRILHGRFISIGHEKVGSKSSGCADSDFGHSRGLDTSDLYWYGRMIVYPLTKAEERIVRWFRRIVMAAFFLAALFLIPNIFTELLALFGQIFGGFFGGGA
jgi:hypothetical protein